MFRRVLMVGDFPLEFLGSIVHLFAELLIDLMRILDKLLQVLNVSVKLGIVLVDAEAIVPLGY